MQVREAADAPELSRRRVERQDVGRDLVHEVAIVRHEQHRAVELLERFLQHVERVEVEVVGRLVEHEHVGRLEHQPRDQSRLCSPPDRLPTRMRICSDRNRKRSR